MKLTKSKLKQLIEEELGDAPPPPQPAAANVQRAAVKSHAPDFTPFQEDVLETNHRTVFLLQELLAQLKTLNLHITPATGLAGSGAERAVADISVAEGKTKK